MKIKFFSNLNTIKSSKISFKQKEIPWFAIISSPLEIPTDSFEQHTPKKDKIMQDIQKIMSAEITPSEIDPNFQDEYCNTILHHIILDEKFDAFDFLMSDEDFVARIDLSVADRNGENILFLAANSSDERYMQKILSNLDLTSRIDPNFQASETKGTFLHIAAANENEKIIEMILANEELVKKIDPNLQMCTGDTFLLMACNNQNEKVIQSILASSELVAKINPEVKNYHGQTILHHSAANSNEKVIECLLNSSLIERLDVNALNNELRQTFVHFAVRNNNPKVLELIFTYPLLLEKIDVSAGCDGWCGTFFEFACDVESESSLNLIMSNEDMMKKIEELAKRVPMRYLHCAVHNSNYRILEQLFKKPELIKYTDPNLLHRNGGTLLENAVANDDIRVLRLILSDKELVTRINPYIKSFYGTTAFDLARTPKRQEKLELLKAIWKESD